METVDQCWWAVNIEPWVTGLIEAGEAMNYFFDDRHIIKGMQRGNENDEESAS